MTDGQTNVTSLAKAKIDERDELMQAIVRTDEATGRVTLAIPAALHVKFNVLAPTAVIAQEDPFFRPTFQVVTLNPDPDNGADFYKLQGKLAPSKVGLQKLGDAAGVVWDADRCRPTLGPRETVELPGIGGAPGKTFPTEKYTYHAVGSVRMSDGTLKVFTADEEWQPQVALMEIEASVGSGNYAKKPGTAEYVARVEKDFLFSVKKRAQMIRSKAMNGVLRQALTIKQAYTPQEAVKPFFVLSHKWSPDATDPNTARIVASLVGADVANLYGGETSAPALHAAPVEEVDDDEDIPFLPADDDVDASGCDAETGEVLEGEPVEIDERAEQLERLGQYVLKTSDYAGERLEVVWAMDREFFGKVRAWRDTQSRLSPPAKADLTAIDAFYAVAVDLAGEAE